MADTTINTERQELINELIPQLFETIKRKGTNVFETETVTSDQLSAVTSLPCLYDSGGVKKQVRVPMSTIVEAITSDSVTTVDEAIAAVNQAISNSETATSNATTAAKECTDATTKANDIITKATDATDKANTAATSANNAAEEASNYSTKVKQAHIVSAKVALSDDEETNTLTLTSEDGSTVSTSFKGGTGKIKSISVNDVKQTIDSAGNVNLKLTTTTDESLDTESSNPVQNAAIATAINDLQDRTVASVEVEQDDSKNTLKLLNRNGGVIASTEFTGGGGGSGTSTVSKIVLSAQTDKTTCKEGDTAKLTYSYNHTDSDGNPDGVKADITITVSRGTTTTYQQTTKNVTAGTYSIDLTDYLLVGTTEVFVKAVCTNTDGTKQTKQAYVAISVITLNLTSDYDLAESFTNGGYSNTDTIEIPFAITGTGTKVVNMYIDGSTTPTTQTITKAGTSYSSFTIKASSLKSGSHVIQLVAERDSFLSQSIYINILKAGSTAKYVGIKYSDSTGTIRTTKNLSPNIPVSQYSDLSFQYAAYDPNSTTADVKIYVDDVLNSSVSVPRKMQTYSNRFTTSGSHSIKFNSYTVGINVTKSDIDVSEATYGLIAKLSAAGRSNTEANPAQWTAGDIETDFNNFNWSSNGWDGTSLKLTNGAQAIIKYKPFESDVKSTGFTLEVTMRVKNLTSQTGAVLSCLNGNKGILFTTSEAAFKTGQTVTYVNEDDEQTTREVKLSTKFTTDEWYKIAVCIDTTANNKLMHLYVNGNRTGADTYDNSFNFAQDTPQNITIDSAEADVEIKTIRIYNRCISDDEELENFIVDEETANDMMSEYDTNNVLKDTGGIDIDKIRAKGKGVLRIVRANKLDDVYAENNKKTDFKADIYYWSPLGDAYNFVLTNCNIRIQGTSSTKYPSKNLRIYCAKGGENLQMTINGVTDPLGNNKYQMRPNAVPVNLLCCKSDYSDSSMSLNTGGAKLFNDVFKELKLFTPPQQFQYQKNNSINDVNIRSAIDGIPIDIFCAETEDADSEFYGQYNLNNEKSKSQELFGQEGLDGFTPTCALTLETLNNTEKTCLFQSTSDSDLAANFDNGLETNYPDDVKWAGLTTAQQTAVKRLFQWIRECKPSGANSSDISTWKSTKFTTEINSYFNKDFLLTYYLWTDYFLSVDQRAKNMLLRTWDGLIWYITYYDGDTQLGKRNDCFLVYDYTTDRDTYDAEASKYAFEGRDSWLWNMVLANFESELKTLAGKLRAVLTNELVLNMFNNEQAGNWSQRESNKSGEIKYITPAIQTMYGKTWPFIYALQGQNTAHRAYLIKNRFALLDAKYGTSNFTSDNIDLYLNRASTDDADKIVITTAEAYAFGYGTNNRQNIQNSGVVKAGGTATLSITEAYTVNDPLRIYGASRIQILDMSAAASHLKNGFDLGKCTMLKEINLQPSNGTASTGWWLILDACTSLRKLNVRNQTQVKTGSNTSTELDLTNQTKLEYLDARGTSVTSINFAQGAPLQNAYLPKSLKILKLEYLNQLQSNKITVESYTNIETFVFSNCKYLDWQTILDKCTNIKRVRITGIDLEGDGTLLNKYKSLGGIDANGNYVTYCALVGKYQLDKYMDDEELKTLQNRYQELTISQPEYTAIVFNDAISDPANITNLDNLTGYEYANDYAPSGHITKIVNARKTVLAKHIGVKKVSCFPLHDENLQKFADNTNVTKCTDAVINDGTMGDIMVYEPHYFYKGVNDLINKKKYSLFRYADDVPTAAEHKKILYSEITTVNNYVVQSSVDYTTLSSALLATTGNAYEYAIVNVTGYKQIRFPAFAHALYGAVFLDNSNNIVGRVTYPTTDSGIMSGNYIFTNIPTGAVKIAMSFKVVNDVDFDYILLTKGTKIGDIEPDWVEHTHCLVGEDCASIVDSAAYSRYRNRTGYVTWNNSETYCAARGAGYQQLDWEMYKDIANLYFAYYGTRTLLNYDSNYYSMFRYDYYYRYLQYLKDEWSINSETEYKIYAAQPDGTTRTIQAMKNNTTQYVKTMVHGRYMDIVMSSYAGTSTTYYCIMQRASKSKGACLAHSDSFCCLSPYGKDSTINVSMTRLAFRGEIVFADTVAEFKALTMVN